jgi:hypothetical protein
MAMDITAMESLLGLGKKKIKAMLGFSVAGKWFLSFSLSFPPFSL